MMLPSGNDAAFALAEHFGKLLEDRKKEELKKKAKKKEEDENPILTQFEYFIKEMNNFASHLKMRNTVFNNPHGLSDKKNKSTSNDIAELCFYVMKN